MPSCILGLTGPVYPEGPYTRLGHVYRVEFFSREIPNCYRCWAILEFTNTSHVIWVGTRKRVKDLLACDRSAQRRTHLYRRCKRCGRMVLGYHARLRRNDEEYARQHGIPEPPCSKWCE